MDPQDTIAALLAQYRGPQVPQEQFDEEDTRRFLDNLNQPPGSSRREQQIEENKRELEQHFGTPDQQRERALKEFQNPEPVEDLSEHYGPEGGWRGQRGSPDLPSKSDLDFLKNRAGDNGYRSFIDRFGVEALERYIMGNNPTADDERIRGPGFPRVGAPMPRERRPNIDPYVPPMGTPQRIDPLGTLRPQDFETEREFMQGEGEDLKLSPDTIQGAIARRLEELRRRQGE